MLRCPTATGIAELKFIFFSQVIMMSHNNKGGMLPSCQSLYILGKELEFAVCSWRNIYVFWMKQWISLCSGGQAVWHKVA